MTTNAPLVDGLLAAADRLLADDHAQHASNCLQACLRLQPDCLAAHNLLEERNLPGALGHGLQVEGRIHPQDDIFRFFASHPTSVNPLRDYLADGWRTLAELRAVLEQTGRRLDQCQSFLEFACGHGRFTRHLVRALPAGALSVSELVPGAVEFLQETMGVKGFASVSRPEQLVTNDTYQLVFVLSLFSHLPDGLWQRWLQRLLLLTAPGGALIFTTHGEHSVQQAGVQLDDAGYFFVADSESSQVESALYGTTFTAAGYVERAIAALPQAESLCVRHVPAHFWGSQDAWVIEKPVND